MSSSTFCLHGYSRLYFSFIQSGIWASEQIHTMLIVLTHRNRHKFLHANLFALKYFCENQYFLWTAKVLVKSGVSYSRQHFWRENMRRGKWASPDWEVVRETPCFHSRSLPIANLSLFMPSLWVICCHRCALTERILFLFCLFPWHSNRE